MALFQHQPFFSYGFSPFYSYRCCVEFKCAFTQAIRGKRSIAVILTVPIC
jgi:hypothetical protein